MGIKVNGKDLPKSWRSARTLEGLLSLALNEDQQFCLFNCLNLLFKAVSEQGWESYECLNKILFHYNQFHGAGDPVACF
jgi:hypothetical protein